MNDIVRGAELGVAAIPTETGLKIADDIGFNEWREIGDKLFQQTEHLQWWIGDWLNYGERYRRDYSAAMAAIDMKFHALRAYAYVASKVESATRVALLSWSHHRAVASLDANEQREWLDEARMHGWSTRELEQAIANTRDPQPAQPTFSIRAIGELYHLCEQAAAHAGLEPAEWAKRTLEHAARNELRKLEAA